VQGHVANSAEDLVYRRVGPNPGWNSLVHFEDIVWGFRVKEGGAGGVFGALWTGGGGGVGLGVRVCGLDGAFEGRDRERVSPKQHFLRYTS